MLIDQPLPERFQYRLDPVKLDEQVIEAKKTLRERIQRSVNIFRIDTGGCNGCDIEIFSAITPVFDVERFGIKNAASPRYADILVYDGPITRAMRMPALRAYMAAPDPKLVMGFGACACTGGIFHDLYCTWGGVDKLLPIDVFVPGCPPSPDQAIFGFCVALGKLAQKLEHHETVQGSYDQADLLFPGVPYKLRITLERKAREMVGYLYGKQISNEFLDAFNPDADDPIETMGEFIGAQAEKDPRKAEVFRELLEVVRASEVGHEQEDRWLRKSLLEIIHNEQPPEDNPAVDILSKAFDLNEF